MKTLINSDYTLEEGMKVKTIRKLKDTKGMFLNPNYISNRKSNTKGVILWAVPGYGGDVYLVKNQDGSEAAYSTSELCSQ